MANLGERIYERKLNGVSNYASENVIVNGVGKVIDNLNSLDSINEPNENINTYNNITYNYGTWNQIQNKYKKDEEIEKQTFPSIALIQGFDEDISKGKVSTELRVLIMCTTNAEWNVEDKYNLSFTNVLYPIYNDFMIEFETIFTINGSVRKRDIVGFGSSTNKNNKTSLRVDAIDITIGCMIANEEECE